MSLLQLTKATYNNVTGSFTPNGLLVALFEINQGNGDMHISAITGVLAGSMFFMKIHQPIAYGDHAITWDASYRGISLTQDLHDGHYPNDGDKACWAGEFLQNDSKSQLIRVFLMDE